MTVRAVAYARVSTEQQSERGVSLPAQKAKLRAYAKLYGLELVDVVVEAGASARTLNRPGLQSALGMLEAGKAEALVVVKLDRLTRSVKHLGSLVDEYFSTGRWALMSVSEQIDTRTAAGRLVMNILASVSQWEAEAIGERTKAALQHKKATGQRVGMVPYGYKLGADGTTLLKDRAEQAALRRMRKLRDEGLSLRAVVERMNADGVVARGDRWHLSTVARLLRG